MTRGKWNDGPLMQQQLIHTEFIKIRAPLTTVLKMREYVACINGEQQSTSMSSYLVAILLLSCGTAAEGSWKNPFQIYSLTALVVKAGTAIVAALAADYGACEFTWKFFSGFSYSLGAKIGKQ